MRRDSLLNPRLRDNGKNSRLDDDSEWEQTWDTKEYVYRERATCRVFWDRERLWIDVEGSSGVAEVRRYMGKRWAGSGAF
jgi:hypothetical protein